MTFERVPSHRERVQRREVGLRGWGSIVPIHTRPTVVWRRSPGARGSNETTSQTLVCFKQTRVGKGSKTSTYESVLSHHSRGSGLDWSSGASGVVEHMLVEHTKAVPQSSGMMRQSFWHVHSTRGRIRWSPVSDPMVLSEQAA